MTVLFVGSNHTAAPLDLIERLAFSGDEAAALLSRVAAGAPSDVSFGFAPAEPLPFREMLILSTPHRVELYAVPADDGADADALLATLTALLAARAGGSNEAALHVRRLAGADAERHLCRVAAGLASPPLGESDIRARLSDALSIATRCGAAGPILGALGDAALRVARRARSETGIGYDATSICSVAAELAEELADDLRGRRALIVGGGDMVTRTAAALRERGYWDMMVVGMNPDATAELAAATRGKTVASDSLGAALAESDLVVAGCTSVRIDAPLVRTAMRGRMARPLALIDLATPRAVDPAVGDLPSVRVADVDELRERLESAVARRHSERPLVEKIVEEELRAVRAHSDGAALAEILRDLHERAEEIRRREVERALERVPDASPDVRAQLESLSVSLTNRLLEAPTRRLHRELANGHAESYAGVTRALFALPPIPPLADSPPTLGA